MSAAPASHAQPGSVRVIGYLAEDARSYTSPGGTTLLEVRVCQGLDSLQAVARMQMGTTAAAQYVCAASARRLTRGQRVAVHAQGWRLASARDCLELRGVSLIEPLDIPHHPALAEAA